MPRLQRSQGGTSLIEVMVSVVLLSIGLLGLVGLQARAVQSNVDSEYRADAALLANEIATTMWLTHDASDTSAVASTFSNWQSVAARALPSGAYEVGAPDDTGAVRVTITWVVPGQQGSGAVTNQFFTMVSVP